MQGLGGWKVNFPDSLASRLVNVIEVLPARRVCVIFLEGRRNTEAIPCPVLVVLGVVVLYISFPSHQLSG